MSRFILSFCLAFAACAAWAQAAPATILVVGDSLSAGYGIRQSESWPVLLDQRLQREARAFRVVNASISGDTTANGLTRLPAALRTHRPRVVVLALGANDGLRGLPLAAMRANLEAMAAAAQAVGARVLIAGMRLPPNYGPDYTTKFHAAFGEVARARNAAWLPFLLEGFAEKREYFQPDTIHPTAAAQPLILDNLWPVLEPLLHGARARQQARRAGSSD
jgi:acyl-CoA thioesterase-1